MNDQQIFEYLQRFFKGVVVDGISRKVELATLHNEGRIEIKLVSFLPEFPEVYLSFPDDWEPPIERR